MSFSVLIRLSAVVLGAVGLSPLGASILRAAEPLGAIAFVLVFFLQLMALAGVAWGLRSLSGAVLLGAAAASPWLPYFGTEDGPWVWLVAMPELIVLAALGWYSLRRETRPALRWLGPAIPSLLLCYALAAPFLRAH